MTASIPHGEAVRNAVRVEWMRLETRDDLVAARHWLNAHGVIAGHWPGNQLRLLCDAGDVTARLGQVLAFNPASGEFTVWEPAHFQAAHSEVVGA